MNIIDLLSQRVKQLRETQTKLEQNLEPLESVKQEIALIERMMGLADGKTAQTNEDNTQSVRDDLVKALQGLIVEE